MLKFFKLKKAPVQEFCFDDWFLTVKSDPNRLRNRSERQKLTEWQQVVKILFEISEGCRYLLHDASIIKLLQMAPGDVLQKCPLREVIEHCKFYLNRDLFLQVANKLAEGRAEVSGFSQEHDMLMGWYYCCNYLFISSFREEREVIINNLLAALDWFAAINSDYYLYKEAQLARFKIYSIFGDKGAAIDSLRRGGYDATQAEEVWTLERLAGDMLEEDRLDLSREDETGRTALSING